MCYFPAGLARRDKSLVMEVTVEGMSTTYDTSAGEPLVAQKSQGQFGRRLEVYAAHSGATENCTNTEQRAVVPRRGRPKGYDGDLWLDEGKGGGEHATVAEVAAVLTGVLDADAGDDNNVEEEVENGLIISWKNKVESSKASSSLSNNNPSAYLGFLTKHPRPIGGSIKLSPRERAPSSPASPAHDAPRGYTVLLHAVDSYFTYVELSIISLIRVLSPFQLHNIQGSHCPRGLYYS